LTACCSSHVNATLLSCCAAVAIHRSTVPCNGCALRQQIILWCSYCGKEQLGAYASYDHVAAVDHLRTLSQQKAQRYATRIAKSQMVRTVAGTTP
jgi:hypothetical protein